jgi:hypothetical protein
VGHTGHRAKPPPEQGRGAAGSRGAGEPPGVGRGEGGRRRRGGPRDGAAGAHDGATGGRTTGLQGAHMEEERGGEGKRERERGGEGELTSGSKSGDHRLQNLGHHGGGGERGCCAGEIK